MSSSVLTGTIICIQNKYVIQNVKLFVQPTPIIKTLIPNDVVNYIINKETNKIKITKLISRKSITTFGIISNSTILCPHLSHTFNPTINSNLPNNSTALININLSGITILKNYGLIDSRLYDAQIILDIYNHHNNTIKPIYNNNIINDNNYIDLTHLDTFNIDPVQSRDFDDAISIDSLNNKIYVHIVDAHSQIPINSNIDISACIKSFTLYLPELVENILPKELAENELSLIKDIPKKTITIEYTINPLDQTIISSKIYKSIIIIKTRYNYEEYDELINMSNSDITFLINFITKWQIKTLNIPQIKLTIDNYSGNMIDFSTEQKHSMSHKIIETLMILTNLTISQQSNNHNLPQRYHEKIKSELNLEEFTNNEFIDSILTIKKNKKALYSSTESGHFGLNLSTYTHFTSPIRRYFDVIVHRLYAGMKYDNLEELLEYINNREQEIDKLTKLYRTLKILGYLNDNKNNIWNAYIINIFKSNLTIMLKDLLFEINTYHNNPLQLYSSINIKIIDINWIELKPNIQII